MSAGELSWKQLLRDFWTNFHAAAEETKSLKFADVITALDEILGPHMFPERADGGDPRVCPTCGNGRLNLKLGKFGAFIGCSNYPECRFTRQMGRGDENGAAEARALGIDPKSGLEVALKSGRFGPYVQLGNGEKPQRSSIPKGFSLRDDGSGKGAAAFIAAARSGPSSRNRQTDHGGLRPLRTVSLA